MPISCCWEDVDPVFKIFKNFLNGSPNCSGTSLFEHSQKTWISEDLRIPFFQNDQFFSNDLEGLGVSKDK